MSSTFLAAPVNTTRGPVAASFALDPGPSLDDFRTFAADSYGLTDQDSWNDLVISRCPHPLQGPTSALYPTRTRNTCNNLSAPPLTMLSVFDNVPMSG